MKRERQRSVRDTDGEKICFRASFDRRERKTHSGKASSGRLVLQRRRVHAERVVGHRACDRWRGLEVELLLVRGEPHAAKFILVVRGWLRGDGER